MSDHIIALPVLNVIENERDHTVVEMELVNQGQKLAYDQTLFIVREIKERAGAHQLDRGLRLNIPFYDDQALEMRTYRFEVIPPGRIMFLPAFVVLAVRRELLKINQKYQLSFYVKKQLITELKLIEQSFVNPVDSDQAGS